MKLLVVGHSMIHIRQQKFFQYVASLGHDVCVVSPGQWGNQRTESFTKVNSLGSFKLVTLRHFGGDNLYGFSLLHLDETIAGFQPRWVLVYQEPDSALASQVASITDKNRSYQLGLFTWENLRAPGVMGQGVVKACGLVLCGNGEAEAIMEPYAKKTGVMLQVGVDTDHFQARPDITRDINVGYVGRLAPEKGVEKLAVAWPTTKFLAWQLWEQLPWWYSRIKVVVCYSQDIPQWKEQAPPYVAIEAMSCGCGVVVSNGGSIPYWLTHYAGACPGVRIVPQNDLQALRQGLETSLEEWEQRGQEGRRWVVEHLSTPVMAKRLLGFLEE